MGSPAIFVGSRTKFLTVGGIEIPNLTTAERNALTAVQGQTIYNSDTDSIDYWDGVTWKSLNQFNLPINNYFSDSNAQDISKCSLYNDGGSTPTDGIGGTPNITKSLNTTTPIIKTSSYRVSKDSNDRQGEGFSFTTDVPLDQPVKQGEPITVQFRYRTSTGYTDGDVKMFVYLVGPNTLHSLNGIRNDGVYTNSLGLTDGSIGQFTAITSATDTTTEIRVIGHIATTSTAAYNIDIDEITISTNATLTSSIVTEWTSYTPTITHSTGTATNYTVTGRWRRVGDSMEVIGRMVFSGTSGAFNNIFVGLPSGYTIDSNKNIDLVLGNLPVGQGQFFRSGFLATTGGCFVSTSTTVLIGYSRTDSGTPPLTVASNSAFGGSLPTNIQNGDVISWSFKVPITQFANATNIISSTQAQFSTIVSRVQKTSGAQTLSNNTATKISFTAQEDPFGVWDSSNNRFINTQKKRKVLVTANLSYQTSASGLRWVEIRVNNTTQAIQVTNANASTSTDISVSKILTLNASDYVEIVGFQNSGGSLDVLANNRTAVEFIEIPDFTTVGISGAPVQVLSTTTAIKIPAGSSHYHQLTNNSLVLSPGVWELNGSGQFFNNGVAPGYGDIAMGFYAANGADNSTQPAALTTISGLTVLTPYNISGTFGQVWSASVTGTFSNLIITNPVTIVEVTQTATVFLVSYASMTTAANARVIVRAAARRIR